MSSSLKLLKKLKQTGLIITPRLDMWLMANGNLVVSEDNAKTLGEIVTKQPRDRSKAFSSSTRGTCLRAQMFQYIGVPTMGRGDARLHSIFIDGTWRHLRWQMMLLEAGILTDIEVPFNNETYRLKGSIDGTNEEEGWGWELKGTSNSSVVSGKEDPYHYHLLQIHTYFLGRPDIDRFVLLYEDKGYQNYREIIVERSPELVKEVREELEYLNQCVDERTLPPVLHDCMRATGKEFRECPYRDICRESDYEEAEVLVTIGNKGE